MKKRTIFGTLILLTAVLIAQDSLAQDYNRWNLPQGARMRLGKGNVLDLAWSPDRTRLAAGGTAGIWLYDAHTGAEISLITGHSFRVNAVAFSPDGLTLASGSQDDTVRLWDVATGEEKSILTGHRYDVEAVAFSHDGTLLASGSRDGTVRVWDVATGQEKSTLVNEKYQGRFNNPWVVSVAYSQDGISRSFDNAVRQWDVETGLETGTLRLPGHTSAVQSVVYSPDGKMLASGGSDGTILLWDVSSRAALQPLAADFDGDGTVGFTDFLQFAAKFGLNWGDAGYDSRFDLDNDGDIGYPDWSILRKSFGRGS